MLEKNTYTVIIPLYNKEKFILRALKSILNQKLIPDEIIVINDGSTDNSLQIVEALKNNKIKIVNQENRGVSSARNNGIKIAKSDYITFLDADDEWLPEFLINVDKLVNLYPEALGFASSYYKKYENNVILINKLNKVTFNNKSHTVIKNYFEVCNFSDPPVWTSAVCIKKNTLLKINGFPVGVKAGEDLLTWARIAILGDFAYINKPLAIYYQPVYSNTISVPEENDIVGRELENLLNEKSESYRKKGLKTYLSRWYKMRFALFLISDKNINSIKAGLKVVKVSGLSLKILIYFSLIIFPKKIRYKILFSKTNN